MKEPDKFYGKLWNAGSGSIVVTIPRKLIKLGLYSQGDLVSILINKKGDNND